MTEEILEQLELFKKYGVTNKYTIKDNKIFIEGTLWLSSLTSIPDSSFLKDTVIKGGLNLRLLKSIPDSNFLKNTIIECSLDLSSLTSIPDSNFLKDTVIGGTLYLDLLKDSDRQLLYSNIKKLVNGTYDKDRGYCYFDGILRTVNKVIEKKGYVIYETPFDYVVQKGKFTAHSKTVKEGILDVEFKIVREKIKQEPINRDTVFTVEYYRMLTGACDLGCRQWLEANEIPYKIEGNKTVEVSPMIASELLTILDKSKPYGYDKFKSLLTF